MGYSSHPGGSVANAVGTSSTPIITPGQFSEWVAIQNTHASQKLSLSFTNPATTSDFTLAPGASLQLPFGPNNTLYAIGSGTGTTFALIGH